MPIYEYECRKCGVFEHRQSISDDPLKRCPTCRSAVQKLLSASAFHLKGGGWYADGYNSKKGEKSKSSDSSQDGASTADSKSSSDGASKTGKTGKTGTAGKSTKSGAGKSSKPAGDGG